MFFQGDIEQLVIVGDPQAAAQHCSSDSNSLVSEKHKVTSQYNWMSTQLKCLSANFSLNYLFLPVLVSPFSCHAFHYIDFVFVIPYP